ncbi:hypothetical protein BJY00DRAFT_261190 [Aspergillus carlsbadensis]|nr:hypothetical protein BJY00DRAFT_261190 [Aspergillus carlsbadensis]
MRMGFFMLVFHLDLLMTLFVSGVIFSLVPIDVWYFISGSKNMSVTLEVYFLFYRLPHFRYSFVLLSLPAIRINVSLVRARAECNHCFLELAPL